MASSLLMHSRTPKVKHLHLDYPMCRDLPCKVPVSTLWRLIRLDDVRATNAGLTITETNICSFDRDDVIRVLDKVLLK